MFFEHWNHISCIIRGVLRAKVVWLVMRQRSFSCFDGGICGLKLFSLFNDTAVKLFTPFFLFNKKASAKHLNRRIY